MSKSDIEIAHEAKLRNIYDVAKESGIDDKYIEPYGRYKAKIDCSLLKDYSDKPDGKLILVTAITPTPFGEGKTTMSIGLADALRKKGRKAMLSLREPSMGPVFGIKGGAAGGGYAQMLPMEDINLHFTGDFHAIISANNLLCAMIDNHIFQGNELDIDPERITFRRTMDVNDRALRNVTIGLGGNKNGIPRQEGFDITAACETMAIICLAKDISDLKKRLGEIIIGYTREGEAVHCRDIKAQGAMAALLKDAMKPNLVQTIEGTPVLVHGGPFANIAHGSSSITATKMAMKLSDYTITEAGFASDLGAENFFDITCRIGNFKPSATVIVATIKALKFHGGASAESLKEENIEALGRGLPNLERHAENIRNVFNVPCVVVINKVTTDTDDEIECVRNFCSDIGIKAVVSTAWEKGGDGSAELADEVIRLCEQPSGFTMAYGDEETIEEKITDVARKIYRADNVIFEDKCREQIALINKLGYSKFPVCIAKTQYSFSDDAKKLGAPTGFDITVRDIRISAGAGFIVALTGNILTMPGLPKHPAAENIDIDENGVISGLF